MSKPTLQRGRVQRSIGRQTGSTLWEALLVAALAATAALAYADYHVRAVHDSEDLQVAAQNREIRKASLSYVNDNRATLLAAAASGPVNITLPMLKNTGYLPAGTSETNLFGNAFAVTAHRVVVGGKAYLHTVTRTTGGREIPELRLRNIASIYPDTSGFVSTMRPAVAQGAKGGWEFSLADYGLPAGGGRLVTRLFFDEAGLVNDYLYRNAVPGRPEVNRMNTAIDMGGNSVNNAFDVNAAATVRASQVTAGDSVSAGNALHIRNGAWDSGWYMSDAAWLRVINNRNIYTAGEMQSGYVNSAGRVRAGEYLQIDGTAAEGGGCPSNSLVSKSWDGKVLSCESGVWRKSGGGQLKCEYYFAGRASDNLPADNNWCPAGMIVTSVTSSGSNQNFYTVMGKSLYAGNVGQGYTCCGVL